MSRVIKRAMWQDDPKIIAVSIRSAAEEARPEASDKADEAAADEIAAAAILDEYQQKAQQLLAAAETERKAIFSKAAADAEAILTEAKQQADACQKAAQEAGSKQGYQDGFAAGKAAGLDEAALQMAEAVKNANAKAMHIIQLAAAEQQQTLLESERKMVDIIMAIADKIIPEHFIDESAAIVPLVKKALDKVKDQNELAIKVAEDDYELILAAKQQLQRLVASDEKLKIIADPLLKVGDCIIESANGNVDARLSTQLEAVKKAIREVLD